MGGGVNDGRGDEALVLASLLLNGEPYGVDEVIDWGDAWGLTSAHAIADRLLAELGEYATPLARAMLKEARDD